MNFRLIALLGVALVGLAAGACGEAGLESASGDSCEDVEADYEELESSNQACETMDDCQALPGGCGVGLGGCYVIVNQGVSSEDIAAREERYTDLGCTAGVCDCDVAPPVDCVDDVCTAL